jgi:hypothetical protein
MRPDGTERQSGATEEPLARGANFEMFASRSVVRCIVKNPPGVDREEGARCAQQMRQTLLGKVLVPAAPYLGLVFDVRLGPEVFGPVTRGLLEGIFSAAEATRRPLAVRVGAGAVQRLQFTSLCRECAPTAARVVNSDDEETAWVTSRIS